MYAVRPELNNIYCNILYTIQCNVLYCLIKVLQYIELVVMDIAIYCIGDGVYCNILYWRLRVLQYIYCSNLKTPIQ